MILLQFPVQVGLVGGLPVGSLTRGRCSTKYQQLHIYEQHLSLLLRKSTLPFIPVAKIAANRTTLQESSMVSRMRCSPELRSLKPSCHHACKIAAVFARSFKESSY